MNNIEAERRQQKLSKLFVFEGVYVYVIIDDEGEMWMKCDDLLKALKMDDSSINDMKPNYFILFEEMLTEPFHNIPPKTKFVNKYGMIKFLRRSRIPKSEEFVEWAKKIRTCDNDFFQLEDKLCKM